MFGRRELAELSLRKQSLVIESELNRLKLRTEWQRMCDATRWVNHVAGFWRQVNPWLVLLAPIAGVVTVRRLTHGEGGIISPILGLLKWVRPLLAVWRNLMATPPPDRQSNNVNS